jgi:hypothetical protein
MYKTVSLLDIYIINPCISLYKNLKTKKQNKNIKNDIIKEYFVKIKLLDNIENEEIKQNLENLFFNNINYNEKCVIITTYNVPKYLSNENIKKIIIFSIELNEFMKNFNKNEIDNFNKEKDKYKEKKDKNEKIAKEINKLKTMNGFDDDNELKELLFKNIKIE